MAGGIHPPPSVIATWPTPNYIDPERRGWGLVVLCILLVILMFTVVTMRLVARLAVQGNAGLDDLCIVISAFIAVGLAISVALASKACGFDRHVWDLPIDTIILSRKITMAIECLYLATTSLTRISILLFHRRLGERSVSITFVYCVKTCIILNIAYFVIFEVTLFAGCRPFDAFWYQVLPAWAQTHEYTCLSEASNLYAASIISVGLDFAVCILPMALFWKLKMPRKQKQALGCLFGVGGFLCICGILRIRYIHSVFYENYDTTWTANEAWIWTVTEALLAIPCASAPALKIFFKKYLDVADFKHSKFHRMTVRPRRAVGHFVTWFKGININETFSSRSRSNRSGIEMDFLSLPHHNSRTSRSKEHSLQSGRNAELSKSSEATSNGSITECPASLRFGNELPVFWRDSTQTRSMEARLSKRRQAKRKEKVTSPNARVSKPSPVLTRSPSIRQKKTWTRSDALSTFEYGSISARNTRAYQEHELQQMSAAEAESSAQTLPGTPRSRFGRDWLKTDPFGAGFRSLRANASTDKTTISGPYPTHDSSTSC